MSDIFISYSSQDRDRAREVADRLTQEGWSVFWDRKIPPGRTWDEFIEEKLKFQLRDNLYRHCSGAQRNKNPVQ